MPKRKKSNAGRPKDMEKRAAILAAARALFLERGFDRTGMDAIAAKAGVSKLTVYGHFCDKEALFKSALGSPAPSPATDDAGPLPALPPKEALLREARRYVRAVFDPEAIRRQRLLQAEALRKPARSILTPDPARLRLVRCLHELRKAKKLPLPQPERAAAHLIGLLKGETYERALLGHGMPSAAALTAHCKEAVAVFWRAYGPAKAKR